jgi:hypothetical protein
LTNQHSWEQLCNHLLSLPAALKLTRRAATAAPMVGSTTIPACACALLLLLVVFAHQCAAAAGEAEKGGHAHHHHHHHHHHDPKQQHEHKHRHPHYPKHGGSLEACLLALTYGDVDSSALLLPGDAAYEASIR